MPLTRRLCDKLARNMVYSTMPQMVERVTGSSDVTFDSATKEERTPVGGRRMRVGARELIVESAAAKFAEFGIDQVSLDAIAQAAHVHRSTLHRHFPDGRDALVIATLDLEAERAAARLVAAADAAPNAIDGLSDEFTELVMLSRNNQVVRHLAAQDVGKRAVLNNGATRMHALAAEHWERHAERARAEGYNVSSAPAEAVAGHVLRMSVSLVADPGDIQTAADVRRYAELFVTPALIWASAAE